MCKAWKIINNKTKSRNFLKVNVTTVPSQPISKVLLVEDDLVFQGTFVRVFAKMAGDCEIHAFQDGASALEALSQPQAQFTLALIDIGLPDITGIEVIAKARLRFAELQILVTTTFSAEDTFLLAIRTGANGYLLKGDTEAALRNRRVSRYLSPISCGQWLPIQFN